MKKFLSASVLALSCWAGAAQAAPTISFTPGGMSAPTGASVFQNFDSYAAGSPLPGGSNAYAFNTSTTGVAMRPAFDSTGNYAAVLGGGNYTAMFGPVSLFSFALGSLDTYNALTLLFANGTTTTYNGAQIINGTGVSSTVTDTGSPTDSSTNGVVTYRVIDNGPLINGATFASSSNAFEFDNLAAVPEPAAWGMMILGFGLVGGVMRRRRSANVTVRFA